MFLYPTISLFVVALQPNRVKGAGEYCHGWTDTLSSGRTGFHCPERSDAGHARFCCGTCALRYCCTAAEARLDQSTCANDNAFELENEKTAMKKPPQVPSYLPFLIVAGAFVSFVMVGSVVVVCCCQYLKPTLRDSQSGSEPAQGCLLEAGGLLSDGMTPSRNSSTSSSSPGRTMTAGQPQNGHLVFGPQTQQCMASTQPSCTYFQPYLGYSAVSIHPEHPSLVPINMDSCFAYRQEQAYPFPQPFIHNEQVYPGVTI